MDQLVFEIPERLMSLAECERYHGDYAPGVIEFGPDEYRLDSPLAWDALVSNVGDALLVQGSVTGTLTTSCARCLEDLSFDIDGEIEAYILLSEDQDAPEDMDEDEFDVLPEDRRLDFEPLITAAALLDLPLVPLCDPDCNGLCMACGTNLNLETCLCNQRVKMEGEAPANNPFAQALAGFKVEE